MASFNPRRSGNPATRATAGRSPASSTSDGRSGLHDRSRVVLARLATLPRLVIPAAMLGLMLLGLSAPLPVALAALSVVTVFVGWLALLSWPVLDLNGRFLRGLMIGLVIGSGVARVNGWL
ncbi:MAG: DUF6703 family protein [Nocardioidaceae bacterium]